ncbi:MAG: NHL repeat-containing protein [Chloroflexota bacterium]|nr:NHL repeat-containing protein [Chloroflexota bacterium]
MRWKKAVTIMVGVGLLLSATSCSPPWSSSTSTVPDVPTILGHINQTDLVPTEDLDTVVGQWDTPRAVVASGDDIFVLDSGNNRVLRLTETGEVVAVFCQDDENEFLLKGPLSMALYDSKLYIANTDASQIVVLNQSSGNLEASFILNPIEENDAVPKPSGIVLNEEGELYVSDSNNHRILHLDQDGQLIDFIGNSDGTPGNDQYAFNKPLGLAIDDDGHLYAADSQNNRVVRYSSNGRYLQEMNVISDSSNFSKFTDVVVSPEGIIYANDYNRHIVQVFSSQGKYLGIVGLYDASRPDSLGVLTDPYGLYFQDIYLYVMDLSGNLYVFGISPAYWQENG